MHANRLIDQNAQLRRLGLLLLFLVGALAIFMLGSPYYALFPTNRNTDYNIVLAVFFLVTMVLVYRNEHTREYWELCFAFFAAAYANWVLGLNLLEFPGESANTVEGAVWDKLAQFIKIVVPVLLLVKFAGFDLGSVGLKRGRVKTWLSIGLGSLVIFAVLGLVVGARQGKSLDAMLSTLPLWLLFSLLNSFMEELWYRGLFVKRLGVLVGQGMSVFLVAFAFALSHLGATYVSPGEILQFVAPTFLVGLGAGYLLVRTDSLWGAVLLHAGADLFYALGFTFLGTG